MTPKRDPCPEQCPGCLADDLDEDFLPDELSEPTGSDRSAPGPAASVPAGRVRRNSARPPPFLEYGYK